MLTTRQREIAALVARGLSDKAIARRTGLSVDTVKRHVGDAAKRVGGDGKPRHRLFVWFFELEMES